MPLEALNENNPPGYVACYPMDSPDLEEQRGMHQQDKFAAVEEVLNSGFHWLCFPAEIEHVFLEYYRTSTLKRMRLALAMGIVLYAVFGLVDWILVPSAKEKFWFIRYAIVCPITTLVFLATYLKSFRNLIQALIWLAMAIGGAGIVTMTTLDPLFSGKYYHSGLMLVIMFAFTLVGMRFWYCITWAVALIIYYETVSVLISHIEFPILFFNSFCIVSATGIGGFSNYLMEKYIRHDFLNSIQLENEKNRLQETTEQLRRLSSIDELTDIANRRYFESFLAQEFLRARRTRCPISLVMIDIDFFKEYNDNYGHQAGDECLRLVAAHLKNFAKRAGDLVARYGGEEFSLVLAETDREGAACIAENIRASVESLTIPHKCAQTGNVLTISAGVATAVPDGEARQTRLVEAADQALYRAKRDGRNRVITHDESGPACNGLSP
jgi:diguanylate cyclase (GGDEF)-like protein